MEKEDIIDKYVVVIKRNLKWKYITKTKPKQMSDRVSFYKYKVYNYKENRTAITKYIYNKRWKHNLQKKKWIETQY